jgi:hypothetical protein
VPSLPDLQASPTHTYIQVLKQHGITNGTCDGGSLSDCLRLIETNGGTSSLAAAPSQPDCVAAWTVYGNENLPPDATFAIKEISAIDLKGPDGLNNVRAMISNDVPLAYGTGLYTDFAAFKCPSGSPYAGNGIWARIKKTNKRVEHFTMIIGYDDNVGDHGAVLVQNSWGPQWGCTWQGRGGFIWIAYETFQAMARRTAAYLTSTVAS